MENARRRHRNQATAEIIDFDEPFLDACSSAVLADLMMEAGLLAAVFAPDGAASDLRRMAAQLSAGERDTEMGRAHARKLAAALKRLAGR